MTRLILLDDNIMIHADIMLDNIMVEIDIMLNADVKLKSRDLRNIKG